MAAGQLSGAGQFSQEETMKPSAEEIALRVDAIGPVLAANVEACVKARSVVPESMQAMVEAG
jgi:hypothetical protein